jgi:hypothetical protein
MKSVSETYIYKINSQKIGQWTGNLWLAPVILAALEFEIGIIMVWGQLKEKKSQDPNFNQ